MFLPRFLRATPLDPMRDLERELTSSRRFQDILFGLRCDIHYGGAPNLRVFQTLPMRVLVRKLEGPDSWMAVSVFEDGHELATIAHHERQKRALALVPGAAVFDPTYAAATVKSTLMGLDTRTEIIRYVRRRSKQEICA